MKKLFKKTVAVVGLVSMMAVAMTGCAKKTECEGCNETKKCHKYECTLDGETETGYLCDSCADMMKGMVDSAKALGMDASMKKK